MFRFVEERINAPLEMIPAGSFPPAAILVVYNSPRMCRLIRLRDYLAGRIARRLPP
jgi:hypothetical protein